MTATPEVPGGDQLYPRYADQLKPNLKAIAQESLSAPLRVEINQLLRNPNTDNIANFVNDVNDVSALDEFDAYIRREYNAAHPERPTEDVEVVVELYLDALRQAKLIDSFRLPGSAARQKTQQPGSAAHPPAQNALINATLERIATYAGAKYADALAANDSQLPIALTLRTEDMRKDRDQNIRLLSAYSTIFVDSLFYAMYLQRTCAAVAEAETGTVEELRTENDDFFRDIKDFQTTGLKEFDTPAVTNNSGTNRWLIEDPQYDPKDEIPEAILSMRRFLPKVIARFTGTNGRFRSTRLKTEVVTLKGDRTPQLVYRSYAGVLEPGSIITNLVGLSENGELVTTYGMPLRPLLEHIGGNIRGLEILRREILIHYSDAVAPEIVNQAGRDLQSETPGERATSTTPPAEEPTREPSMRQLILARRRVIKEDSTIVAQAVVQELEEGAVVQAEANEKPADTTDREERHGHPVIGYRRRIGPDQRASARAREEATKVGIDLPEFGWTYTRPHSSPAGAPLDPGFAGHTTAGPDKRRPSEPRRRRGGRN